ncbi:MAG: acetolactate synthase 2 small subunit [Psychrobium sp.]
MSSNSQQLKLTVKQSPEVLERVLRVARHRGFKVEHLEWQYETGELTLTVSSQRAIYLLINQLDKLVDVVDIAELAPVAETKTA